MAVAVGTALTWIKINQTERMRDRLFRQIGAFADDIVGIEIQA